MAEVRWSDEWDGGSRGFAPGVGGANVVRYGDYARPEWVGRQLWFFAVFIPRGADPEVSLPGRYPTLEAAKAAAEAALVELGPIRPSRPRREREVGRRVENRPEPARWPRGARGHRPPTSR